jgi:heme-degrading monooxygenase HmoA
MVTIGMDYRTLPGKEQEFVDNFRTVLAAINEADGHDQSRLYEDVDEKGSYLIVSNWNELEAFQGFIQSDAFKEVTAFAKENILAERPKHKVYRS